MFCLLEYWPPNLKNNILHRRQLSQKEKKIQILAFSEEKKNTLELASLVPFAEACKILVTIKECCFALCK